MTDTINPINTIDEFIKGTSNEVKEKELMDQGFLRERDGKLYMTVKLERKSLEAGNTDTLTLQSIVNNVYSGEIDLTKRASVSVANATDAPIIENAKNEIGDNIIPKTDDKIGDNTIQKTDDDIKDEIKKKLFGDGVEITEESININENAITDYYNKITSNINNINDKPNEIQDFFDKNEIKSAEVLKNYIQKNMIIKKTETTKKTGGYISKPRLRRKSVRRSILKSLRRSSRPSNMRTLKSYGSLARKTRRTKYSSSFY